MSDSPITLDETADVIVTLSAYTLGKTLGLEAGMRELERQMRSPDRESLPAARTVARLRELSSVAVRADTGGTVLGQVRSRHAHDAWHIGEQIGASVWVSVDDDVEATTATLLNLLVAVGHGLADPAPRIVVAPCLLRLAEGRHVANVEFPLIETPPRVLPNGARLRKCKAGGFGLVAMNRAALGAVRKEAMALGAEGEFIDADGVVRLALFHTAIRDRRWLSEDLSFFARVPPSVSVEALVTGHTAHAGRSLDLSSLA